MDDGITVKEFKHIPGVNDAEYIKKLEELHENDRRIISIAVAKIKKLSSQLKEQPKRGKWLPDNRCGGGYWVCSSCKNPTEAFAADVIYKYCPFCGAKMERNEDGTDL